MRNNELLAILRRLQSSGFRDLAGSRVSATVPVSERLINEVVAASLPRDGHLREAHVHPEPGGRFAVRMSARAAMLPSLTVKLEIERQPELPASPVLVLRLATMGGLLGMASAALPIAQLLPAGVRIEGDHIHIDLRAMAAERGLSEAIDYLTQLRITTEDGRVVVHVEGAV